MGGRRAAAQEQELRLGTREPQGPQNKGRLSETWGREDAARVGMPEAPVEQEFVQRMGDGNAAEANGRDEGPSMAAGEFSGTCCIRRK